MLFCLDGSARTRSHARALNTNTASAVTSIENVGNVNVNVNNSSNDDARKKKKQQTKGDPRRFLDDTRYHRHRSLQVEQPPTLTFDLEEGQVVFSAVKIPSTTSSETATLTCTTSSDDGDADLYMRIDDFPVMTDSDSTSRFDCKSTSVDDDVCSISEVSNTFVHVAVKGYTKSSDVTLECEIDIETERDDIIVLQDGVMYDFDLSEGSLKYFKVEAARDGNFVCEVWGESPDHDIDLFVSTTKFIALHYIQKRAEQKENDRVMPTVSISFHMAHIETMNFFLFPPAPKKQTIKRTKRTGHHPTFYNR